MGRKYTTLLMPLSLALLLCCGTSIKATTPTASAEDSVVEYELTELQVHLDSYSKTPPLAVRLRETLNIDHQYGFLGLNIRKDHFEESDADIPLFSTDILNFPGAGQSIPAFLLQTLPNEGTDILRRVAHRVDSEGIEEMRVKLQEAKDLRVATAIQEMKDRSKLSVEEQMRIFESKFVMVTHFFREEITLTRAITTSGVIIASLIAYQASTALIKYMFQDVRPNIIQYTNVYSLWGNTYFKDRSQDLKLTKEAQKRFDRYVKGLQKHDHVSNFLFHGPPGTGKTLTAMELVRQSGCNYIFISGASLQRFPDNEALEEANKLMDLAEKAGNCLLIVDEAETLFEMRKGASEEAKQLVVTFLARISGAAGERFGVVLLTNMPEDIDPAIIDRISKYHELPFAYLPLQDCQELLHQYAAQFNGGTEGLPKLPKLTQPISGRTIEDIARTLVMYNKDLEESEERLTKEELGHFFHTSFSHDGEKTKRETKAKQAPSPKKKTSLLHFRSLIS